MVGLAIHTSSPSLGLAVGSAAVPSRVQTWPLGRDLSGHLHTILGEFLSPDTWADLSFIAVAAGPGGFTGTRIGVVTARTLAQQLNLPLFGVSSLAAIAHGIAFPSPPEPPGGNSDGQCSDVNKPVYVDGQQSVPALSHAPQPNPALSNPGRPDSRQLDIAVELLAQRGEVFGAIYTVTSQGLLPAYPEQVQPRAAWEQVLAQWPRPYGHYCATGDLADTVVDILALAWGRWHQGERPPWSSVLPFYGQHPVSPPLGRAQQ